MHLLKTIFSLNKKIELGKEEITLQEFLKPDQSILVVSPQEVSQFPLFISTIHSCFTYFQGEKFLMGSFKLKEAVHYFFKEANFEEPDSVNIPSPEILLDLSRPPSPFKEITTRIKANFRVSTDPSSYPYYNVIIPLHQDRDDLEYGKHLLNIWGIPYLPYPIIIEEKIKRKMWDFLLYKGHREENFLVFVDLMEVKRIRDTIEEMVKVTFVSPRKEGEKTITLSNLSFPELLTVLSLANLVIASSHSVYTGLGILLKLPVLSDYRSIRLPTGIKFSSLKDDNFELKPVLQELLHK